MIITCPNCHTSYRVGSDALSAAGRQVQCATCATEWTATPTFPEPKEAFEDPDPDDDELGFRADDDTLFTESDENLLDAAFVSEDPQAEQILPSPHTQGRGPEGKLVRQRKDELAKRRNAVIRTLPMARFRRTARISMALVAVLAIAGAIGLRNEIVRNYPETNALYRVVGLGTNVIGLDFVEVNTLRTSRDGNPVIVVHARISNVTDRLVRVPNILVSLLESEGVVIYEWSVTPSVRSVLPGDVLSIDTQLTSPPAGVEKVRLSFVENTGRSEQQE
ncbi:MJ0042-type zinc finger domain-containing protein [Pelagibacterium limicola]|uniref:MJ0042-type zinc finger domain-containing protein n=1 Tax=Pelagibacterium limicola TaxID=2791022 RepID=UPI0018AFFC65